MIARAGSLPTAVLLVVAVTAIVSDPARASIPESRERWVAYYDSGFGQSDRATSVVASADGSRVMVTGTYNISSSPIWDFATVAYSAGTGDRLWTKRWGARFNGGQFPDIVPAMAVSRDGTQVFVAGRHTAGARTVAYSAATGEELWVETFGGNPRSLSASPDGSRLYVTGEAYLPPPDGDYVYKTVAYSTATGAAEWTALYEVVFRDEVISLAVGPDGQRVYVTGRSLAAADGTFRNYTTVAYAAATGTQQWEAHHDGAGSDDYVYSIAVSPDGGRVYVTGLSNLHPPGGDGPFTYAFDTVAYTSSTGAREWLARYEAGMDYPYFGTSIAVSTDGNRVYVTGTGGRSDTVTGTGIPTNTFDYHTVAYLADSGAQVWVDRYDGSTGGPDVAFSIAASPDGASVYVSGFSALAAITSPVRLTTLSYAAATGERRWVAGYAGPDPRGANGFSVSVSPDSDSVYVAGSSSDGDPSDDASPFGAQDFLTVAYRATSCASGLDERGSISGPMHETGETPGPAGSVLHGVNCEIIAPAGL